MATSFVSTSNAYSAATTSLSPAVPASVADDDLLIALVALPGLGTITSVPSGWTHLGSQSADNAHLYWKLASSESGTYTWQWGTSEKARIQIAAYRGGFDTTDPIDAVSNTNYGTYNTTLRAADFSVTDAGSVLIFAGYAGSAAAKTFTPPSNPGAFSEDVDTGETTSDTWITFANYEWSSSGSTGNIDATISGSTGTKHAFCVSLTPASNTFTAALNAPVPTASATFKNSNDFTAALNAPVPVASATFLNASNPFTAALVAPVPTASATFGNTPNTFTAALVAPVPVASATFEQANDFTVACVAPVPVAHATFNVAPAPRVAPWKKWACEAFGNDTVTPAIWAAKIVADDFTPGDGVTPSTYPTFNAHSSTVGYYAFDGVDDYISNWPTMPATYVVSAALSDSYPDGQPYITQCSDTTLETLLTTPGAFTGNLHNIVIFDSAITAAQKQVWADYQLRRLWRDTYVNPYTARLIRRGYANAEFVFTVSGSPYTEYSGAAGAVTPSGITWADGLTFDTGASVVTVGDVAALRSRVVSVFASGVFGATGHIVDKGTNYEVSAAYAAGAVTITANGVASAAIPVSTLYSIGVTMEDGHAPVFYVNGLAAGVGGSPATVDLLAVDDLLVGNQAGGSSQFTGTFKRLSVVTHILKQSEIFMLHLAAMADF